MPMKTILVTDSLFIFPEHEQVLKEAGYLVERLDTPAATEEELCKAVKGKAGYILGGIEKITAQVINAADSLEAIVLTGIGYKEFIPGWEAAKAKGIAIGNVPDGPTHAVAEWMLGAALAMNRGFFELGAPDGATFLTTKGLEGQTIGIIALGRIGRRVAELVQPFRPGRVLYYSTHRHPDAEAGLGLAYEELDTVLGESDVIFLPVPIDEVGQGYFGKEYITKMKPGALLVNINRSDMFDVDALYDALKAERIRMVSDYPMDDRFNDVPRPMFYSFNASNAFNTRRALAFTSESAVRTLLNILATGNDENRVL